MSQELIRIAILWHEMWHEALEEASRLYFGESNVEAMLGVLLPLHELMDKTGPSTLKEIAFVQVRPAGWRLVVGGRGWEVPSCCSAACRVYAMQLIRACNTALMTFLANRAVRYHQDARAHARTHGE